MKTLVNISLILVIILVSLSAYIRLAHSGIGCADWPDCYGRVGEVNETMASTETDTQTSYEDIVQQANEPYSWATPLHRFVASTLGLLIVFLALIAIKHKKDRLITLCLVALTVYLAILGIRSGSLIDPAVIMGNLTGGFIMLGLLGWLAFKYNHKREAEFKSRSINKLAVFALLILSLQILIGGLTSANFAATACQTLPDCHGSWLPGQDLFKAFDLSKKFQLGELGEVMGGVERMAIHKLHRIGAVVALFILLIVGISAVRLGERNRLVGSVIILLVLMEFSIGVLAVLSALPITMAVMHNWLSGLLVLALLYLIRHNIGSQKVTGLNN